MNTPAIAGLDDLLLIGHGGFADVYRARQPRFDRVVAVKVLRTPMRDEQVQAQFQRECSAAGRLTGHPNIVTVLQSGFLTTDGRPYIVMEWMEGGSFEDRLRAGPLPPAEVARTGVKLCGALQTAHEVGVLHRDIKPANILVSAFGEPALADFGISSISSGTGMTSKLDALSPLFAAPEIIEGAPASVSADVYALAASLFALLEGRPAFAGAADEPMMALVVRVLGEDVPHLTRADVHPAVAAVVRAGMAKSPAGRPGSAAEFGEQLRQAQVEAGQVPTELVARTAKEPWARGPDSPAPVEVAPAPTGLETPNPAPARLETPNPAAPNPAPVAGATVARPRPAAEAADPESRGPSLGRRILVGASAGALVAVFIVGGVLLARARGTSPPDGDGSADTSTTIAKLQITGVEDRGTTALIQWSDTASPQATHVVRRSPAASKGALEAAPPGTTSAEVKDLDPATGYCFRVGAILTAEQQSWSEWKCIRGAVATAN